MPSSELEIRTLETPAEMAEIVTVLQQVWGSVNSIVSVELLCAVAHAGGYVAGAYESGSAVGASFAFLSRHHDERALHSHVTGILPGLQHQGAGRTIKTHQRQWAAERSIPWITWTFDPLVRRNAWFNIAVLGSTVTDYLINFYGTMSDSVNGADDTDRLMVAWATTHSDSTHSDSTHSAPAQPIAAQINPSSRPYEIPTPDDIVVLRRTDPIAAAEWRTRVRREFTELFSAGGGVTDFTRSGMYVVHSAN
jgi:predicted GNAT superfamily acetyltransferase